MLLLASWAASLSSPLGGFLCGVIIPLPMYPLSAIHPEGSRPSSSPEGAWCGHVVHGAGVGVGGPHEPAVGQDQDLDVHAGRLVLARPQFAVIAPAPAGEESAVHHVIAPLGHLLGREQHVLQGPGDRIGHGLDDPRDRGLGHTQLLADHRLRNVVTHVDQRRPQRIPQPQARRTPLNTLLAQTDEQIGELGRGQPRGILHDDGPFLMRLLTIFHQPSYLMGSGHHNIDSRKCTQMPTE